MPGNSNSGRRPQPATILQMKGRRPGVDSGGRPLPVVPDFRREPPTAPEWLTPEARAEWDRVVPGLALLELLKPEDRAMLAAYCETWATFVHATRYVREHGATVEHEAVTVGPTGAATSRTQRVVNPFIAVARAAGKELRGFGAQFGLSPSSETALGKSGGSDGGEDNPFE